MDSTDFFARDLLFSWITGANNAILGKTELS